MESNVAGPALIAQHFLPLLKRGGRKLIINMTSGLGSISKDLGPKCCTYSISKAALNMLVSSCHELHSRDVESVSQTYKQAKAEPDLISFVIDPGWNKTGKD